MSLWTQQSARWFSRTGGCLTESSALPVPTPTSANLDCPRPSEGRSKSRCPQSLVPESMRWEKATIQVLAIARGEPPDLSMHRLRAPNAARAEGGRRQRRPPAPAALPPVPRGRRQQHREATGRPRSAQSGSMGAALSPCQPPASASIGPADLFELAGRTRLGLQTPSSRAHTRSRKSAAPPPAVAATHGPPRQSRARPSTCGRPPPSPTAAGGGTPTHRQRGEATGGAQRLWRRATGGGVANRAPRSPGRRRPAPWHHPSPAGRPP